MNEIVTTSEGTRRLTLTEHATIHAPQDQELLARWKRTHANSPFFERISRHDPTTWAGSDLSHDRRIVQ